MKRLLKPFVAVLVVAFAALAIHSVTTTNNRLELRQVELKSSTTQLKTLQVKYDHLNEQLNKALQDGQTTDQQLKQLQDEKQQLEKEKADLEQQVSLKKAQQQKSVASVGVSATAYAATDPNTDKLYIYMRESGNNPGAINASSGACGLGQALPCSKMPCSLTDYACQDNYFTGYALARYGSWSAARAFWDAHNWW